MIKRKIILLEMSGSSNLLAASGSSIVEFVILKLVEAIKSLNLVNLIIGIF